MATRYWVGGSGTWDAVSTTNWAASSGGAGGASVPTYADNVIFDTLSNATLYTVTFSQGFVGTGSISGTVLTITAVTSGTLAVGATINSAATAPRQPTDTTYIVGGTYITSLGTGTGGIGTYNVSVSQTSVSQSISGSPSCLDITVSAPLTGAVTFAGATSARLSIYGSMTLAASNVVWSSVSEVIFCANTTGKTVTTNGVSIGTGTSECITFDGVGGGWTLGSSLTTGFSGTTLTLRVNRGDFSTGNFSVTTAAFISLGTLTRSINLGSSTVTLTGANPINFTSTGLTLNAGTSAIALNGSNYTFAGGGNTFYNVNSTRNANNDTYTFSGSNTFNNLTFANRGAAGESFLIFSENQTINSTLNFGNPTIYVYRRFVRSDVVGTQRTLTVANAAPLTAIDFKDIIISGAAAPISGTSIGNAGNNSGITFSTPKTVYWNSVAGNNWGATAFGAWATTSGGTVASVNFPLAQDTAIIENTGLNSGATITNNASFFMGRIDFSTRTLPMTWALSSVPQFYGPLFLSSAVTITGQTIRTGTAATTYTISGTASGVLTPIVNTSVNLASLATSAVIGDVSVSGKATVSLTGLFASAAVTPSTVYLLTSVYPIGVQSSSYVGSTTEYGGATVYPSSQTLTGFLGYLIAQAWDDKYGTAVTYDPIVPSSGSGYTTINPDVDVWTPITYGIRWQ